MRFLDESLEVGRRDNAGAARVHLLTELVWTQSARVEPYRL